MRNLKTLGRIVVGIVIVFVALFALGYVLTMGQYPVPETVAQDPSIPHITLNGVTYHAESFGDPANPVVIAVHGGPGGDYRSLQNLQDLSDPYDVVFFDLRGAGLSPRVSPDEITIASAISDLDSIVDHFGAGKTVNLIGHSWGAMLVSAYLGQHPEKVDHVVLAEPGFLTSEFAERWAEATRMKFSAGILYHFLKSKFESLHVQGPDTQAAEDYFAHQFNLYQGDGHPQAGYRCDGERPDENGSWRYGAVAANTLFQQTFDSEGNFDINLVKGVDGFTRNLLFLAGECQTLIGAEYQREQMKSFPKADLVVIPAAGHEIFDENPAASLRAVRAYLNSPAQ